MREKCPASSSPLPGICQTPGVKSFILDLSARNVDNPISPDDADDVRSQCIRVEKKHLVVSEVYQL